MSDFLREVDEDYRREQMLRLWKRFGPWVIAAMGLVVIAVAIGVYWRDYREGQQENASDLYVAAQADFAAGRTDEGFAKLTELQAEGSTGMEALALISRAEKLAEAGRRDEAIAAYEALLANNATPEPLRSFGSLMVVQLQLDTMPADEVVARLKDMAVPGQDWYGAASEAIALALMREGRSNEALGYLEFAATDPSVPETLRQRAVAYMQLIGPRETAGTPADAPTAGDDK